MNTIGYYAVVLFADFLEKLWFAAHPAALAMWGLATIILLRFIATRGWHALSRWQRWYAIAACIATPIFVWLHTLDIRFDGSAWIWALLDLCCVVIWVGIANGLILLVKMTAKNPKLQS
jgi:hypothetical protein